MSLLNNLRKAIADGMLPEGITPATGKPQRIRQLEREQPDPLPAGPDRGELRELFERLNAAAIEAPGIWSSEQCRSWSIAWRVQLGELGLDRHTIALKPSTWPPDWRELGQLLESCLPRGYAPLRLTKRDGAIVVTIGRRRDVCAKCGDRMDSIARVCMADVCAACALEAGDLEYESLGIIAINPKPRRAT
jgi:hypothetical protein